MAASPGPEIAAEAQSKVTWVELFKAHSSPEAVAKAWVAALPEEERQAATDDAPAARARLRREIVAMDCAEVRADAAQGWKYTGALLRAADAALGIPPPVPSIQTNGKPAGAPSGKGAPEQSRMVLQGDGRPGTLGLWWSDFATAAQSDELAAKGITRRLNMAAEAVDKFPDGGLPTHHIPMVDIFDPNTDEEMMAEWRKQLQEVVDLFSKWQEEGAVVNVSCQMGKNRSGAVVMLWLCHNRGWDVSEAADYLRSVTHLALGNPHLAKAVTDVLGVEAVVPLNPAFDGGGWVCISPPGSPRASNSEDVDGSGATQDVAGDAAARLLALRTAGNGEDDNEAAANGVDVTDDLAGLFEGM